MSKINLGNKRVCVECGAKFYDLGNNPAACPKCKTMNDINAQVKVRRKNRVALEVDNDDPLIKHKEKQDARQKPKKTSKNVEVGVDLEDFEDVLPVEGEDEIEELEEIDDIEDLEDLEELEDSEPEEPMDDDITIDDDTLIDDIEDADFEEVEEDEAEPEKKSPASKAGGKGKKK